MKYSLIILFFISFGATAQTKKVKFGLDTTYRDSVVRYDTLYYNMIIHDHYKWGSYDGEDGHKWLTYECVFYRNKFIRKTLTHWAGTH